MPLAPELNIGCAPPTWQKVFLALKNLFNRYPGWVDEEQIDFTLGFYLLGMNACRHNKVHLEVPISINNVNFNRIF